jgi:ATP-dependent protease ClpP protease subunit
MNPTLLLIIDRELSDLFGYSGDADFYDTSLYINDGDNLIPISIRTWSKYSRLTDNEIPEEFRKFLSVKEEIIADFDIQIGESLRKTVLSDNSKLTLNVILNSDGGHDFATREILSIFNFIKRNGGIINSFSFFLVANAASDILSSTDNRFCLKLTEFMCHASTSIPEMESIDEKNTAEENEISLQLNLEDYERRLNKFFENANPKSTKIIKKLVRGSLKMINCDLYLSGKSMESLGLVKKAYKDFKDFLNFVQQNIGKNTLKNERLKSFVKKMRKKSKIVFDDNTKKPKELAWWMCP